MACKRGADNFIERTHAAIEEADGFLTCLGPVSETFERADCRPHASEGVSDFVGESGDDAPEHGFAFLLSDMGQQFLALVRGISHGIEGKKHPKCFLIVMRHFRFGYRLRRARGSLVQSLSNGRYRPLDMLDHIVANDGADKAEREVEKEQRQSKYASAAFER